MFADFCGFVAGGLSHRVSLEVPSGVCVGVRVRRSNTGLSSHRVSLKLSADARRGEGVCRSKRGLSYLQ